MKFKRMLIGTITSALAISTVLTSTFSVSAKGIALPQNVPVSITSTAQTSEQVSVNPTKSGQPISLNSSNTSTLPLRTTSVVSSFAKSDEVEANASANSSAIYGCDPSTVSYKPLPTLTTTKSLS